MTSRRLAVGLMSGTSADGVTAALIDIRAESVRVLRCQTYPYPPELKKLVLNACQLRAPELSRLNFTLGHFFGQAAKRISAGVTPAVIGSHGQTIYHGPDEIPPHTLQIAESAVIAEMTGISVVSDFRPRDIAAGGQGAPLVPAFDLFLFGQGPLKAVVNIGGISNISIVGRGKLWSAFDTGPGNSLMDEAVRRATHGRLELDRAGRLASTGRPDEKILKRLLAHPYFKAPPPKSLDRTAFGPALLDHYFPKINKNNLPDILATLSELTVRTLWYAILENTPDKQVLTDVMISGGGALNTHILRRLRSLFAPLPVTTTDVHGIPVMAKEAACFAWMGDRALSGKSNHHPLATGAKGPRVLGKIIA